MILLYVRNPKTGGSTISRTLYDYYGGVKCGGDFSRFQRQFERALLSPHKNCVLVVRGALFQQICQAYAAELQACQVVTNSRNPYSRLVSAYGMSRETGYVAPEMTFKQFVNRRLNLPGFSYWHGFRLQARGIYDVNGPEAVRRVHTILRLECLQLDFNTLMDQLGWKTVQLPRRNASVHKPWPLYYHERLQQRVARLFSIDFQLLPYTFSLDIPKVDPPLRVAETIPIFADPNAGVGKWR